MRRFRDDRFLELASPADAWSKHNRALRDAFRLLALNLCLTALAAWWGTQLTIPLFNIFVMLTVLVVFAGLLFVLIATFESILALLPMLALSGLVGLTLGPIINLFLSSPDGGQIVMTSFGVMSGTFLSLSVLAVSKRSVFSLAVGVALACVTAGVLLWLAHWLLDLTTVSLIVSATLLFLIAGHALYQTRAVVDGRATRCIPITIVLQFGFFRVFFDLLQNIGEGMAT